MRKFIGLIIIGAILTFAQVASAGPFEDGTAAYRRGDFATALKLLRPLAEQGNAWAQYLLGEIYDPLEEIHYKGQDAAPDYKEAAKWYRLAANQGNSYAQYNLGEMYLLGHGVAQDYVRTYMWWDLAASSSTKEIVRKAIENQNIVVTKMTNAQVDQAVEMEKRCQRSHLKDCD